MTVGRRHAQEEPGKFLSVPYVVQPAIMLPTHQTISILAFVHDCTFLERKLTVVVHSSHCATVARVSEFDGVCRSSSGSNRCSKAKNKSATNELSSGVGSSLNGGS